MQSLFFNFTLKPGLPDGFIIVFARTFNILTLANGRAGIRFTG